MRSLAVIFVLLAIVVLPTSGANAQSFGVAPISIDTYPQYPRPYDTITVTPGSTLLNLSASEVTISANGAIIEQGSGARSASVVLGGPGSSMTIRVTASQGGSSESAEVIIRPADVSLVLEPLTTGAPFFKGGLLVAPQSEVRLIALADFRTSSGTRISPSALSYTWRVGNRILLEESGIGRSTLIASAPVRYRNADVSVTVSTTDDAITGYASSEVVPATPKVFAYRIDPLLGIDLAHALSGTIPLLGDEDSFSVVPYYFREEPSLVWTINGVEAGADSSLTVRTRNDGAARATIGVTATGLDGEAGSSSFTASFSGSRGTFGF